MNRTRSARAAAALLAAAGLAHGAPLTETFTYQAQLEDSGVLADGTFDFRFQLFDAAAGGNAVGGQIFRTNTPVADGLVNTTVNFGGLGLIFDGERRWLEVAVRPAGAGAYTVLGPRQELTTTPYAAYALNADTAAFAENAMVSLDEAYDAGRVIDANAGDVVIKNSAGSLFDPATLRVGRETGDASGGGGRFEVSNTIGNPIIEMFASGSTNAGTMFLRDANEAPTIYLDKDVNSGGGGFFSVYRHDGTGTGPSVGFQVDGNVSNTLNTQVLIRGNDRIMFFDTNFEADNSVRLPTDAISATEVLDEPGVAETADSGSVVLTQNGATIDVLASTTITCPAAGYVLVIATAEVSVDHKGAVGGVGGTISTANFGVSSTSGSIPSNGDIELRLDNDLPTGLYDFPVTVHAVFPASAGANTFYFLGDQNSTGHSITTLDLQLSCVYLPTAYGVAGAAPLGDQGDDAWPGRPRAEGDVLDERARAIAADQGRRDAEFIAMQEQIARLEERLDAMQQGGR